MVSTTDVSAGRDGISGQNDTQARSSSLVDAEVQALNEQIDNARTLTDVRAVIERLKCWVAANAQYREWTYSVFAQLYRREEGMKEAVAEAESMGLSVTEQEQRERLSQLRLRVRAEDDQKVFHSALEATRQALAAWRSDHPDDPIITHIDEHLQMEEQIASQLHEHSDTTA